MAQQQNRQAQQLGGAPGGGQQMNREQMKAKVKDHFQNKVMKTNEYDNQVWVYVSDVPKVSKLVSYLVCFVNVILPGWGTWIAAFAATSQSHNAVSKTQLSIGLMQFLTTFALIGWIWSIYWGYLIIMKAMN